MCATIRIAGFALIGIAVVLPAQGATNAQTAPPQATVRPATRPPATRPQTSRPQTPEADGIASTQVVRPVTLTKEQLDEQLKRLSDSAVIESGGERKTKAQVRAMAAEKGEAQRAKAQAALDRAHADFERRRSQLEQQRQAKLQADHAKAVAEFNRSG